MEGGRSGEEEEVHGGADCLSAAAGGAGQHGCGGLPEEGNSEQTFYLWKKKYAGMDVSELRRVKQLEEENRRLKQMVADLTLDKQMLQEVLSKKF